MHIERLERQDSYSLGL